MAQKIDFNALKARTMGSGDDEEAVTVDTRGLISKVLARYSGKWTVLREMIQNAADANATKVTVRFETLPSMTVPLPSAADSTTMIKHTISHHTLRRLLISNNGLPFSEKDWARLKRIADGNPDETKIGAFGVGFYSVFDDCEEPFVSSGKDAMAFYWKGNALFTRRLQLNEKANPETTFVLDYRNDTSPIPSLMQLCQFLSSSLTFVSLECIELWLDDWNVLRLCKKTAPSLSLTLPRDIETKTQDGLMKVTAVTREVAQVDAHWMQVVEWNPNGSLLRNGIRDTTVSLRGFLSRLTLQGVSDKPVSSEKKDHPGNNGDLTKMSMASVFLHINTASIQASISQSLSNELERATRKPPPKKTSLSVLTPSYDTSMASAASGSQPEFLSSILPSKGGRVFIGFPTHQTTGLNAHISAPSVIPTVERESIDLNTRYISRWNMEMLRAAGIVCRVAWSAEMASIKSSILSAKDPARRPKIRKDDIMSVIPEAIHAANQFVFRESTPSSLLGQTMEDAFWTCNKNAAIEVLSTCGIVQNHEARIASKDLNFIDSIPVLPDEFVEGAKEFVKKLTVLGLVNEVTVSDIKRELEASTLRSHQITEFLAWLGRRALTGQLDPHSVKSLLTVAVANTEDENGNTTGLIVFSGITSFLNPQRIPADLPLPPTVIPFKYTKTLAKQELEAFDWIELPLVPWVRWLVSNAANRDVLPVDHDITQTPSFSTQVLPVLSKQWESLSPNYKQLLVDQLQPHTVIPTRVGMKRPAETYFPSVRLFDDLPVVHGVQGVKEKFLAALGVRKTVELGVIFERLLNAPEPSDGNSSGRRKWSHVDLIRYLASVSNDIPTNDIKRLKDTSFCMAELSTSPNGSKTPSQKRYKVLDLFEPNDALRVLGLPLLEWPGKYLPNSNEGQFLTRLGLRGFPTAAEVIQVMAKAASSNNWTLHGKALSYFLAEYDANGYGTFDYNKVTEPFLPIEKPDPGLFGENTTSPHAAMLGVPAEGLYDVSLPGKCFTDPGAALFGFRILRGDLHRHASKLGVKQHPRLSDCLDVVIQNPPSTKRDARVIFRYLAGRASELTTRDMGRVSRAEIVPVSTTDEVAKGQPPHRVAPKFCYLGEGEDYKDIFDFVDFGHEANLFLMAVGSKREPTKIELAQMVVKEPARISSTFQSADKYLKLLRTLAEDLSTLKKNKELLQEMKRSAFLLASKDITSAAKEKTEKPTKERIIKSGEEEEEEEDDDETGEESIREWTLTAAKDVVVVDDIQSFILFKEHVLAAPQEEVLENFYIALGAVPLSRLVEERAHWGAIAADQRPASKLLKLINERTRLFLHDHPRDTIQHDSRWVENHLQVQVVQSVAITRSLKDRRISYKQERRAIVTELSKTWVMRICPGRYDFYEISQALSHLILSRPKLHSTLTLEMLLKTDLLELRARGYNVERILRQKAQEAKIAEDRRQKQLEEERKRLQEKEDTWMKEQAHGQVPEQHAQPAMPGVFPDSPSNKSIGSSSPQDGSERAQEKRRGLFSNFTRHFKDGNRSSWNPFSEISPPSTSSSPPPAPPPGEPKTPLPEAPVTVGSPLELQKKLMSAVQSSRPHGASGVFSRPQTNQIADMKSYCDEKPGHDLEFVANLPCRLNVLFSKTVPDRSAFLAKNFAGMNIFGSILIDCADVFSLRSDSLSVFYEPGSKTIAFNRSGSIFCNYHFFQQLHEAELIKTPSGSRGDAMTYWWVILCHELAHNLVGDHSSAHSFYSEGFVTQYFPKMAAKIAAVCAQPGTQASTQGQGSMRPTLRIAHSTFEMAPLLGDWSASAAGSDSQAASQGITQKSILYIDAYDSFSYNVVAMLEEVLKAQVTVMMIDAEWPDGNMVEFLQHYDAVVLGPGPGDPHVPTDVGVMADIWNLSSANILPVLGICLGFQSLCLHHGISIGRLPEPLHGQVHRITTAQRDIFEQVQDLEVTLYHSFYAQFKDGTHSTLPGETSTVVITHGLDFLAWLSIQPDDTSLTETQIPMAVRHMEKPFWGVQFHPESCKSDRTACDELLRKWWEMSLNYNKRHGRGGYGRLPADIIRPLSEVNSLSDAAFSMLNWSTSSSKHSAFRTLTLENLDAERICESLNSPGSPLVLFQSNGRHSVMSVPSPGSWRLEYYIQTQTLRMETLQGLNENQSLEKVVSVCQLWDVLRYLMDMKKVESGDSEVPFWAGFLGYFSYELGLACLAHPKAEDSLQEHCCTKSSSFTEDPADVSLLWTDRSIVVDNQTGRITVQSTREEDNQPSAWLDATLQYLKDLAEVDLPTAAKNVAADAEFLDPILRRGITHFPDEETYLKRVEACKDELRAGESYELCLTGETSITLPSPETTEGRSMFPWKMYKRLWKYNPAAFSAYAKLGNVKIISSSPECFLNWDRESTLEMKPMKGTVRKSDEMTLEKARQILGSTKEMAENLMIADLIRHDLYGICGTGGVHVEKLLEVEDHGRVYQMITHVKGVVDQRRPGYAARSMPRLQSPNMSVYGLTALQRCLPPGSMTGAPKERSCVHLSSIEGRKRGVYSGVMGFLDLGGGGSFSVLIRTAFTSSDDNSPVQKWRIGAGGAVTILSTAEGEWDEMLTKLRTVCGIFTPLDAKPSNGKIALLSNISPRSAHLLSYGDNSEMAGTQEPSSLEEILWRSPPHVQMMGGYLHSNNILFYFAESPFFDATSNNASLAIQANYNEAFRHFVETREAFEGRLKTMQGLEFVVAYDPLQAAAQSNTQFARDPSNIWVIRKQTRRKRAGLDDEVVVLATFFVVGDCIYMAPSVASVVGNRILSAVTSLTSLLKTASTLPIFTPSHGHTYLPPAPKSTDPSQPGVQSQGSKENTPMPDVDASSKAAAALVSSQAQQTSGSTFQDLKTLAESFNLLSRYGDEFMDENPLVGEPGSFILSKAGDTDRGATAKQPPPPSTIPGRVATPQVKVDTPGKTSEKAAPSGAEESKLRRKKSKLGS
ncbi:hypothetical protein ARAM_002107 [Aspergillus rambellii]|uniref:Mediator of RNA polymerase II transcription subunit 6 n=1 Tax=Aspergillus rambellii TaxID=308745 RepID=A0A0F8UQZ8_9EURO|nr:hypothetical protein ARAM_002107 [Aspergillus rambellii]